MKKVYRLIEDNIHKSLLHTQSSDKLNKHPVITISREKGSGGTPLASLVAKTLGNPWKVFHYEIMDQIAKEIGIEKWMAEQIDEGTVSLIDEIIADLFGKRYFSEEAYHVELIKIMAAIRHRGYAVIIGRGGNFLIPDALKVRVIADYEQRIKWVMKYEKLTRQKAKVLIDTSDERRRTFIEHVYHKDQQDPYHYDLVIKTGENMSLEEGAQLIVSAAKNRFKLMQK